MINNEDRVLASVQKIVSLEPIKDKDRIELATIQGWNVIVQKGEFNEGDLCIYIQYDTLLPERKEFEFLRKRCYSKKYGGFRIRNIKMAGVFSQGIVFGLDILPKGTKAKEGLNVTEILGIKKYDPTVAAEEIGIPENPIVKFFRKLFHIKRKKYKVAYPADIIKANEKNIQVKFNEFLKECDTEEFWIATEKLEGQAATYEYRVRKGFLKKDIFNVYSHNIRHPRFDNTSWWKVAKMYDIEKKMKELCLKHNMDFAIQGEIVGPGIQKNIYGLDSYRFFVYNITVLRRGTQRYQHLLTFDSMKRECETLGLQTVPYIDIDCVLNYHNVNDILENSNGYSTLKKDQIREGLVWRNMNDSDLSFKAKSPKYLMWWEKVCQADEEDEEEE